MKFTSLFSSEILKSKTVWVSAGAAVAALLGMTGIALALLALGQIFQRHGTQKAIDTMSGDLV